MRPYDIGSPFGTDAYHAAANALADEFLREAESLVGDFLDGHLAHLEAGGSEPGRSRGEHAIELLSFGLLRGEYGRLAMATPESTISTLSELWRRRSGEPARKAEADDERGRIFLSMFHPDYVPAELAEISDTRLVDWLACTGEFVQEALRMRGWLASTDVFWSAEDFARATDRLAGWFAVRAAEMLGSWTAGVAEFRRRILDRAVAREDLFLITRRECLYHLNMVGAEVMNRGFRPGYARRASKVVLVPGCMRIMDDPACGARRDGLDISCTRCHGSCEVAALDRLAEENGFRVYIVPHASTFTAWLEHWTRDTETALVAVACPLHLVPGGYEMRALDLQAQCVLLDYSGCRRHWSQRGVPTRLDRAKLLSVVRG